jgi:RimJ/RimL family protein N-acetyltransferase
MRCEGRLRDNHWMKERWWDALVYGVIEDEWKARKE